MKFDLNQGWKLHFTHPASGEECRIPAQVPGNVIGDLTRSGIVEDPYFGCNSLRLREYEFIDWEYQLSFDAPELQPGERFELTLGGVDTVFTLLVNGVKAGEGANMFIAHTFDVTTLVHPGAKNELRVAIVSSVNYARRFKRPPYCSALAYNYEGLFLRRAMHTYGWDIAPRLVGAGLWRGVTLETVKAERWTDLYLYTALLDADKTAHMTLDWSFESPRTNLDGFTAKLVMECGDSHLERSFTPRFVTGVLDFDFPAPRLWQVAGWGKPNLYDVELKLEYNGETVDVRKFRTGIRTVELIRSEKLAEDGSGQFLFKLNNEPLFIKGSNWVPSDALHGERPERVGKALELFAELGCNMVRCWGGSVYEGDDFFNRCDELGLLVWQDFMFACEMAPQEEWFLREVGREAVAVIEKLRMHPSLALWCGDNECDELSFWRHANRRLLPSFNRISREVLKRAVEENDPARDYLPSSPFLHDDLKRNNTRYLSPEQHLWGPRDNYKSNFYRDNTAIFASEIGYHGMPAVESMLKFLPEKSLNGRIGNPDWNCHAAQPFGDLNGAYSYRTKLMIDQVAGSFGTVPESIEEFSELSQIVQAEAFKFFIENFRMHKFHKTGLIWWNVIDCWPQFSDAVVDYYYTKKLAFHYIRRAQQPVALMFSEPDSWCIQLTAVNDLLCPVALKYRVRDLDSGVELLSGSCDLAANSAAKAASLRICQGEQCMYLIEWEYDGKHGWNHYTQGFTPLDPKRYAYWLTLLRQRPDFAG